MRARPMPPKQSRHTFCRKVSPIRFIRPGHVRKVLLGGFAVVQDDINTHLRFTRRLSDLRPSACFDT